MHSSMSLMSARTALHESDQALDSADGSSVSLRKQQLASAEAVNEGLADSLKAALKRTVSSRMSFMTAHDKLQVLTDQLGAAEASQEACRDLHNMHSQAELVKSLRKAARQPRQISSSSCMQLLQSSRHSRQPWRQLLWAERLCCSSGSAEVADSPGSFAAGHGWTPAGQRCPAGIPGSLPEAEREVQDGAAAGAQVPTEHAHHPGSRQA